MILIDFLNVHVIRCMSVRNENNLKFLIMDIRWNLFIKEYEILKFLAYFKTFSVGSRKMSEYVSICVNAYEGRQGYVSWLFRIFLNYLAIPLGDWSDIFAPRMPIYRPRNIRASKSIKSALTSIFINLEKSLI